MLNWAKQFNIFCFLDSQQYQLSPRRYECLLAAGCTEMFTEAGRGLEQLDQAAASGKWLFGHFSYSWGEQLYGLPPLPDPAGFPLYTFFHPQHLLILEGEELRIESPDADQIYKSIISSAETSAPEEKTDFLPESGFTRQQYLETVKSLQEHLQKGDCYEINFCQEFYSMGVKKDPFELYRFLSAASPCPYAALYRLDDRFLICASPERFLFKEGSRILSQPMKGTAERSSNPAEDEKSRSALFHSSKDRSENVMVVDLVRNDLSRICRPGSVKVDELYGIQSYPRVHQMVSTVSGELLQGTQFSDIMKACFPMGSMTGAPKKKVMELIRLYERRGRGIFSGTLGYLSPEGDADFNVVIRSIMYRRSNGFLGFQVGSGITIYSDPQSEWEECMLKAEGIKKVLKDSALFTG